MNQDPHRPPPTPPAPAATDFPSACTATPLKEHLPDEIEVDLDGLDRPMPDPGDTLPEGMDYLGAYDSIPAYLRAMLEPEVSPACGWLLDHLDYVEIQRRWERDGCCLMLERGRVYRVVTPADARVHRGP